MSHGGWVQEGLRDFQGLISALGNVGEISKHCVEPSSKAEDTLTDVANAHGEKSREGFIHSVAGEIPSRPGPALALEEESFEVHIQDSEKQEQS